MALPITDLTEYRASKQSTDASISEQRTVIPLSKSTAFERFQEAIYSLSKFIKTSLPLQEISFSTGNIYNDKDKVIAFSEATIAPEQLASGSEQGGDSPMAEQYFDKFLDQRFASIDEKISSIKEENNRLREDFKMYADGVQRSVDQALAELRERDNQRHKETQTMYMKIDELNNKIDGTNKWIIGFIITTGISVVGLVITAVLSIASLLK